MPVKFENESSLKDAIKDVRSDASGVTWVLATHVDNNPEVVRFVGSGTGGYEEIASNLNENSVFYALYRVTQKIDLSTAVKFVYVYFIGEQVPALQRGKIGSAQADVKPLFTPFHIDFEITQQNEIDSDTINRKIGEASGKMDNVRDGPNYDKANERGFTSTSTKQSGKKQSSFGFQGQGDSAGGNIDIDSSVTDAINDLRNDKTDTNWLLISYRDGDVKKPLILLASGKGGVEEMNSSLTPDLIAYGLIRVIDLIENIKTVKYVFLYFIGADVSIMKKAKVSTNKGAVTGILSPYHVTFEVSSTNELSDEILLQKSSRKQWI